MSSDSPRKYKFIGCEVLYREACYLAATVPHRVDVEFLLKGLHDLERGDMLRRLQEAVDAVPADAGYQAVLLGYARCNDGVSGLTARSVPLVIPRAHDCITFFFGSRGAFQEYFDSHPGTYYLTSGWSERNQAGTDGYAQPAYGQRGVMAKLGLAESYEQMVAKYGKENADYIVQTTGNWLKSYDRFLYLRMGACDEEPFVEAARRRAAERGWQFLERQGDWSLLRKLFLGQWDEDFQIVQPGESLVGRNDRQILDVAR